MKLKFFNIFLLLFAAVACGSCSSEGGIDLPDEPDPASLLPPEVYLNLNVGVLSQSADSRSRAYVVDGDNYFEATESKYERMNTLRVIIVRGSRTTSIDALPDSAGYVEHNHLFKFNELGLVQFDDMTFKVRSGEKKKIYLIANEAFIKSRNGIDFDDLKVAEKCTENFIEDIILKAEAGQPLIDNTGDNPFYIPMSEEFDLEIPIPEDPLDYQIDKSFFITRAAVKFTFTLSTAPDYPATGLTLKNIIVNSINDLEYMLPHGTEYSPSKDVADSTNDLGGRFITKYDTPDGVTSSPVIFPADIPVGPIEAGKDKAILYAPELYYPESETGDYTLSITLGDEEGNENDYTFPAVKLDNLDALPRNTHVLINLTLTTADITAEVKLVPYIGVPLSYFFGFDELIPWEHGRPSNNDTIPVPDDE